MFVLSFLNFSFSKTFLAQIFIVFVILVPTPLFFPQRLFKFQFRFHFGRNVLKNDFYIYLVLRLLLILNEFFLNPTIH